MNSIKKKKVKFKFTNNLGKNSHFSIIIWFYIHLVKTSERHSLAQFSWTGQGSCGIYMRQEYFLNKPIQREKDFGGQ